ncbi:MAG: hypothetical protein JSU00_16610 [Acidobacteria bacterium]|nr:hypothetical protein [Acidobacteriota bacterium]
MREYSAWNSKGAADSPRIGALRTRAMAKSTGRTVVTNRHLNEVGGGSAPPPTTGPKSCLPPSSTAAGVWPSPASGKIVELASSGGTEWIAGLETAGSN